MACRPHSFGMFIRNQRIAAGLSLREVARGMGITAVYLGEVERGVRGPFVRERWMDLVRLIPGVTLDALERQANLSGGVKIDLSDAPPEYQDLGLALARRIERRDLEPTEVTSLLRILRGDA
ncbi:MAG: helix-turn-helix domain-containing protein [Myxococcales bacterium]|nr:helix-turn-helix domain-containing protein [Myxococcales bacterium]